MLWPWFLVSAANTSLPSAAGQLRPMSDSGEELACLQLLAQRQPAPPARSAPAKGGGGEQGSLSDEQYASCEWGDGSSSPIEDVVACRNHRRPASVSTPALPPAVQRMKERDAVVHHSRSGSYARDKTTGRGIRRAHAEYAWEHFTDVSGHAVGTACLSTCLFGGRCGLHIAPATYFAAHQRIFGPDTTRTLVDGKYEYNCSWSQNQTMAAMRDVVDNAFVLPATSSSSDTDRVGQYYVERIGPVCEALFRRAYFLRDSTWKKVSAAARKGTLKSEALLLETGLDDDFVSADSGVAMTVGIEWWKAWLMLEDQMPNEPLIVHRVVIWKVVHESEYTQDMAWWMPDAAPLSRSRWVTLRSTALRDLSFDHFGPDISDPEKPAAMLRLVRKAQKSRFGECKYCAEAKEKWTEFRTNPSKRRLLASEAQDFKTSLNQHIMEVKREREKANLLMRECQQVFYRNPEYDDKCGSDYLHFPVYHTFREPSHWTGRWRYRCGLQGNLYPGDLLRFSMVPPHLRTGSNFGISSHLCSLHRMEELGRLGKEQVRQTDSGPDNDAMETHAYHTTLIHVGVLDKLTWIRLTAKHSHNLADRMFSLLKEVIAPKRGGSNQGCSAPWDLDAILQRAMKTQTGRTELAWHLANWNFKSWFEGCIDKDFGGISSVRYIIYEYDPTLVDHGCVRVTYRENLLDEPAGSLEPQFKPAMQLPNGKLVTNPAGHRFMTKFPSLLTQPPFEPFLFSEKSQILEDSSKKKKGPKQHWNHKKIFSDIREFLAPGMTNAQQSQWEVLDDFHKRFPTADLCPNVPFSLSASDGSSWDIKDGCPIKWHSLWMKLALRCPRPNYAPAGAPAPPLPPGGAPAGALAHAGALAGALAPGNLAAGASAEATAPAAAPRSLAQMNALTGADFRKTQRRNQLRDESRDVRVQDLPPHREKVDKGDLVFVRLEAEVVEGALMVGFGKIKLLQEGAARISWFGRNQWTWCSGSARRWEWATTPHFKALPHTRESTEKLECILPITAQLTPSSQNPSKPRLTAECVRELVALCKHRKLIHAVSVREKHMPDAQSGEESEESGTDSDASDSSKEPGPARKQPRLPGPVVVQPPIADEPPVRRSSRVAQS